MKKLVLRFRKNKIRIISKNVVKRKKVDNSTKKNSIEKISAWLNFNKNSNLNLFSIH